MPAVDDAELLAKSAQIERGALDQCEVRVVRLLQMRFPVILYVYRGPQFRKRVEIGLEIQFKAPQEDVRALSFPILISVVGKEITGCADLRIELLQAQASRLVDHFFRRLLLLLRTRQAFRKSTQPCDFVIGLGFLSRCRRLLGRGRLAFQRLNLRIQLRDLLLVLLLHLLDELCQLSHLVFELLYVSLLACHRRTGKQSGGQEQQEDTRMCHCLRVHISLSIFFEAFLE